MHSLLILLLLGATPVPPASVQPFEAQAFAAQSATPTPTPKISISRGTPESKHRTVSRDEVMAAYERIQRMRSSSQPLTPTPTPVEGRHKVDVIQVEMKPKSEIPIQRAVERPVEKKSGLPAWTPKWEMKKQFAATDSPLKLDYQWKGIVATVEMTPATPEVPPIRVLLNRQSADLLPAVADTEYRVTVQGRLPEDTVWIPLYTFEKVSFKSGQAYQVVFPESLAKPLREYIAEMNKQRLAPVSTPQPVELTVTPEAGVQQ